MKIHLASTFINNEVQHKLRAYITTFLMLMLHFPAFSMEKARPAARISGMQATSADSLEKPLLSKCDMQEIEDVTEKIRILFTNYGYAENQSNELVASLRRTFKDSPQDLRSFRGCLSLLISKKTGEMPALSCPDLAFLLRDDAHTQYRKKLV